MLVRKGYTHMVVQIGNGCYEPDVPVVENFHLDWYRLKNSLQPDMSEASLIISHGGIYSGPIIYSHYGNEFESAGHVVNIMMSTINKHNSAFI